jgi:hypothetical protein
MENFPNVTVIAMPLPAHKVTTMTTTRMKTMTKMATSILMKFHLKPWRMKTPLPLPPHPPLSPAPTERPHAAGVEVGAEFQAGAGLDW